MKPSLPMGLFDCCVVPMHDSPKALSNVIQTRGVMNRIQPKDKQSDKGLILIGGPSKHHAWDDQSVIAQLQTIVASDNNSGLHHWTLTTSRRTPDSFLPLLERSGLQITVIPHTETDSHWLPEQLGHSDVCWVTEDSVSMIYESLSAGCKVGLIELENHGGGRVVEGVNQLKTEGMVCTDPHDIASMQPEVLAEADRVAAQLRALGWV